MVVAPLTGATQVPTPRPAPPIGTEQNLQDPVGLVLGWWGGMNIPRREAFDALDLGYSVTVFVSTRFEPVDDMRLGLGIMRFPESTLDDAAHAITVFLEPGVTRTVSSVTFRAAPRVTWTQVSRSFLVRNHLRGFGVGAAVGAQFPLTDRAGLDVGTALTLSSFGPADIIGAPPDPDRNSLGTIGEIRLGMTFRIR